jgi:hypothetical protein
MPLVATGKVRTMNKELKEFLQAENTIAPMVSDLWEQRNVVKSLDFDRETAVLIGKLKRG